MRERDKKVIWPVYFDSTKTRSQGRRVPKKLAAPAPKLSDIRALVEKMGLRCDLVAEAAYPSSPWRKTGYVWVSTKGSKNNLLRRIAENLPRIHP